MRVVAQPFWHTTSAETITPVEWSAAETASAISARDGQAADAAAVGEAVDTAPVVRPDAGACRLSPPSPERQAASRPAHATTAAHRYADTRPPPLFPCDRG